MWGFERTKFSLAINSSLAYFAIRSITLRFRTDTPLTGVQFSTGRASEAWQKKVDQGRQAITAVHPTVTYTRHEAGQFDREGYRQPEADDGAKLHNLPKERYLPAEVTLANPGHLPRRGIELEAHYQNPPPLSTAEPGEFGKVLHKKKNPAEAGFFQPAGEPGRWSLAQPNSKAIRP
jgi:hypothetical protein